MGSPIFYRSALARSLTEDERALVESCLARSEQIEALALAIPGIILANRSQREGREITLTKSQLRTIRYWERAREEGEAAIPKSIAEIPSVHLVLRTALESERDAKRLDEVVYTGGHPDDAAVAKPLLDLRTSNIEALENFLSRS